MKWHATDPEIARCLHDNQEGAIMLSGKGKLTIDGSDPVPVDYDLGDDGRGYLSAARPLLVRAHLGHRVELQRDNRATLRLIIEDIGSAGGGDFRVQDGGAR